MRKSIMENKVQEQITEAQSILKDLKETEINISDRLIGFDYKIDDCLRSLDELEKNLSKETWIFGASVLIYATSFFFILSKLI